MGRPKPYDPAALAKSRHAHEEIEPLYDAQGFQTETRRRVNVFLQWRDTGATEAQKRDSRSMSAHGVALMAVYAKAHGVDGGRDLSVEEYIDQGFAPTITSDWANYLRALSRANAGQTYVKVMGQVGFVSSRVLTGLCHDWFYGDGRYVERANGRREAPWRAVVRQVYRECGRNVSTSNEESMAVWEALQNLQRAKW